METSSRLQRENITSTTLPHESGSQQSALAGAAEHPRSGLFNSPIPTLGTYDSKQGLKF